MVKPTTNMDSTGAAGSDRCREVLVQFVQTVDVTGGVIREPGGCYAPVADPEWIDLGEAYAQACAALHRKMLIAEDHLGEDQEGGDARD